MKLNSSCSGDEIMKLLFISDLHFKTMPGSMRDAVELVEKEDPDVLLLGGDYESFELFASFLMAVKCPNKRKAVFILGNNDEFEISERDLVRLGAALLDYVTYVNFDSSPRIIVTGFSRNFSLREKPYSITTREAISRARRIRNVLPEDGFRIVMLHEVPTEILTAARAVKPDLRFNPHIADAASKVAEILGADLVLVGHLHIPGLDPLAPEIVKEGKRRVFILATWPNRNYVVIEPEENHIRVEVKKYPGQTTLIMKKLTV